MGCMMWCGLCGMCGVVFYEFCGVCSVAWRLFCGILCGLVLCEGCAVWGQGHYCAGPLLRRYNPKSKPNSNPMERTFQKI